ncbi:hypothetical protein LC593_30210 [Nostoc sp. CHAB 5844]|nr:hypothetical protein [Nostoc sp. CHAB 5844]
MSATGYTYALLVCWVGDEVVQEMLTELWDEYQPLKYSNQFINDILQTPRLWEIELNPPIKNYREIYLVDYPDEVEIFVEPIFCIVGVLNVPVNQKQLESRIMNVLQIS